MKRWLSVLLCAVMVFGMIPFTALAGSGEKTGEIGPVPVSEHIVEGEEEANENAFFDVEALGGTIAAASGEYADGKAKYGSVLTIALDETRFAGYSFAYWMSAGGDTIPKASFRLLVDQNAYFYPVFNDVTPNFGEWSLYRAGERCEDGDVYIRRDDTIGLAEFKTEYFNYGNHDFGPWTYVDDSSCARVCRHCGFAETAEHNWGEQTVVAEATHESDGLSRSTCYNCGATVDVVLPRLTEHVWDADGYSNYGWEILTESKNGEYGVRRRHCRYCDAYEDYWYLAIDLKPLFKDHSVRYQETYGGLLTNNEQYYSYTREDGKVVYTYGVQYRYSFGSSNDSGQTWIFMFVDDEDPTTLKPIYLSKTTGSSSMPGYIWAHYGYAHDFNEWISGIRHASFALPSSPIAMGNSMDTRASLLTAWSDDWAEAYNKEMIPASKDPESFLAETAEWRKWTVDYDNHDFAKTSIYLGQDDEGNGIWDSVGGFDNCVTYKMWVSGDENSKVYDIVTVDKDSGIAVGKFVYTTASRTFMQYTEFREVISAEEYAALGETEQKYYVNAGDIAALFRSFSSEQGRSSFGSSLTMDEPVPPTAARVLVDGSFTVERAPNWNVYYNDAKIFFSSASGRYNPPELIFTWDPNAAGDYKVFDRWEIYNFHTNEWELLTTSETATLNTADNPITEVTAIRTVCHEEIPEVETVRVKVTGGTFNRVTDSNTYYLTSEGDVPVGSYVCPIFDYDNTPAGMQFDDWTMLVDGVETEFEWTTVRYNQCTLVETDVEFVPRFVPARYYLGAWAENGTVYLDGEEFWGGEYEAGTVLTLTTEACEDGLFFHGWYKQSKDEMGGSNELLGSDTVLEFTMPDGYADIVAIWNESETMEEDYHDVSSENGFVTVDTYRPRPGLMLSDQRIGSDRWVYLTDDPSDDLFVTVWTATGENDFEMTERNYGGTTGFWFDAEAPAAISVNGTGYRYAVNGTGVTVTGYNGPDTELEIPEEIDGKAVTSIGENAFSNGTGLTGITIPVCVLSIGENAFKDSGIETVYGYTGSCSEVYANHNQITFVSIGEIPVETEFDVSTEEELFAALNRQTPVDEIHIVSDFTIHSDCMIYFDAARFDNYRDTVVYVDEGVTLTVGEGGKLGSFWPSFEGDWETGGPNGRFVNNGFIIVENGGAIEADFDTNNGSVLVKDGGEAVVCGVNNGDVIVEDGGLYQTSQGKNAVNNGEITIHDGATMISCFGSAVINGQGATLRISGEFRCGCIGFDGRDVCWFENSGLVCGDGVIVLYEAASEEAPVGDLSALAASVRTQIAGGETTPRVVTSAEYDYYWLAADETNVGMAARFANGSTARYGSNIRYYNTENAVVKAVANGVIVYNPFVVFDHRVLVKAIRITAAPDDDEYPYHGEAKVYVIDESWPRAGQWSLDDATEMPVTFTKDGDLLTYTFAYPVMGRTFIIAAGTDNVGGKLIYNPELLVAPPEVSGIRHGLLEAEGKWYYYVDNEKQGGWQLIDGYYHYFDPETFEAVTGELVMNGGVVYTFDETGKELSGFGKTLFGTRLYVGPNYSKGGKVTFNGEDFYYVWYNYLVSGDQVIDGRGYHFDENGLCQADVPVRGFIHDRNGYAYIDEDGNALNGLQEIDGSFYFFDQDGYARRDGSYGGRRIGSDYKAVNGILGGYYYVDGVATEAGVIIVEGDIYFAGERGSLSIGNVNVTEQDGNGILAAGRYLFDYDYKLANGIVNGVYYADGRATMAGLVKIGGDFYFAGGSGVIVTNKTQNVWLNSTGDANWSRKNVIIGADGKVRNGVADGLYYEYGQLRMAGLVKVGEDYYFAGGNGVVVTNKTQNVWLNSTGEEIWTGKNVMIGADGRVKIGIVDGVYYEYGQPKMVGLVKIGEDYYFAGGSGVIVTNKTQNVWLNSTGEEIWTGKNVIIGADGRVKIGIVDGVYYEYGQPKMAGLVKIGEDYYFAAGNGAIVTNKTQNVWANSTGDESWDGKNVAIGADGKVLNGFIEDGDELRYYKNGAYGQVGLQEIDGDYYFIGYSGKVYRGGTIYVWATNGLSIEMSYVFDAAGRIIG